MFRKPCFVNTSLEVRSVVAHISSKGFLETFFQNEKRETNFAFSKFRPRIHVRISLHSRNRERNRDNNDYTTTGSGFFLFFFSFFLFLFYTNREKYGIPYIHEKNRVTFQVRYFLLFFLATFILSYKKKMLVEKFKTRSLLIDSNGDEHRLDDALRSFNELRSTGILAAFG